MLVEDVWHVSEGVTVFVSRRGSRWVPRGGLPGKVGVSVAIPGIPSEK